MPACADSGLTAPATRYPRGRRSLWPEVMKRRLVRQRGADGPEVLRRGEHHPLPLGRDGPEAAARHRRGHGQRPPGCGRSTSARPRCARWRLPSSWPEQPQAEPAAAGGMRALAAERGWAQLIAPVGPNWKARYLLHPIQRYAAWTRPDGLPFDRGRGRTLGWVDGSSLSSRSRCRSTERSPTGRAR
jgi:hypothetical protein